MRKPPDIGESPPMIKTQMSFLLFFIIWVSFMETTKEKRR